jgi:Tfp pilus assembly protein PilO
MTTLPPRPVASSSTRSVDAAGIGALLLITALAYFAGVEPAIRRAGELRAAFNSITDRAKEAQEAEGARLDAERKSAALGVALKSSVKLLPIASMNERLAALADTAKSNNITVSQLTPGTPTVLAKYMSVPVKISGNCTYPELTRLLRQLHEIMPDTAVENLAITVDPNRTDATSAYSIDLVWYAAPAASAAAVNTP